MFWILIALIGALVVFILTGYSSVQTKTTTWDGNERTKTMHRWKPSKKSLLAVLPLLLVLGGCFASVPAGHTGVLITFGKVEELVLHEGVNFKLPYQQVILVDNRIQRREFLLEAFSSDIQQTDVSGSINFTINKSQSQTLYRNVGTQYYDTVIYPRVLENVKLVFSSYSAEGLIENRTLLSNAIMELMNENLKDYGIENITINLENIDFTDTFTDAVETKQVAQQKKLTVQTEQESAIIIANAEAEKRVIAAQAEAETARIDADAKAYTIKIAAEAQAEANQKVAQSLTAPLIEYTKLQKWDGKVPQVQVGNDGSVYPVINMPESEQTTEG